MDLKQSMESLLDKSLPLVSNLSNAAALIFHYLIDQGLPINWAGFYLAGEKETLYLGPFQGKVACTIIPFSKGVCGKAATTKKTVIVPNVHEFPGHIACDSSSESEIVFPLVKDSVLKGVLDIDAYERNVFTEKEKQLLEAVCTVIIDYL